MDEGTSTFWQSHAAFPKMQQLCAHFDGGKRETAASCGWHLQGSHNVDPNGEPVWHTLAWGSMLLDPSATSLEAEFHGLAEAINAAPSWSRYGAVRKT
jgi:hypothetical protein